MNPSTILNKIGKKYDGLDFESWKEFRPFELGIIEEAIAETRKQTIDECILKCNKYQKHLSSVTADWMPFAVTSIECVKEELEALKENTQDSGINPVEPSVRKIPENQTPQETKPLSDVSYISDKSQGIKDKTQGEICKNCGHDEDWHYQGAKTFCMFGDDGVHIGCNCKRFEPANTPSEERV